MQTVILESLEALSLDVPLFGSRAGMRGLFSTERASKRSVICRADFDMTDEYSGQNAEEWAAYCGLKLIDVASDPKTNFSPFVRTAEVLIAAAYIRETKRKVCWVSLTAPAKTIVWTYENRERSPFSRGVI